MVGNRNAWHRRWLDYRQLAERLRPMRSLKLLGIAAPDPPGTRTNPVPRRWIDWYAIGIWRAMGAPGGVIDRAGAKCLAVAVADYEVDPQVRYHRRNATVIERLDGRLEWVGTGLFAATLIVAGANLIGILTGARFVELYGDWFNLIEAGFPALGTAIFGIRFQADFGGDALRSMTTAQTLERIDSELRKDIDLCPRRRPCRTGRARHAFGPRRMAVGQPAAPARNGLDLPRRAAALHRPGFRQLHAALLQRLAQQAFDLRIDRAQFARGKPLDRRPQGGVDAERIGLALGHVDYW